MSKTSWQVKKKYNDRVYGTIAVRLSKELVNAFKQKCKMDGISQAQVVKSAVIKYLKN